ncbi:MAG: PLD nuclease N-terminal domain-containing protein [Candidatus Saccharicenans sp.]|uniref:PLD nuclease N-terminal domain-containing protein n=1 Tax=Candidatus Saccharicenans sp. TaxID=2819258 RepID=UPI004049BA33
MFGLYELAVLFLILSLPLFIIALVDILKHDFPGNDKIVWLLVVIFLPFLGPILYFLIGRQKRIKT